MKSKSDKLFVELINKMLEPHGVTYDYIYANQVIDGQEWYNHFTWSQVDRDKFKKYAIKRVKKVLRATDQEADYEVGMFMLAYSLKIK